jgi:hypothetical protein
MHILEKVILTGLILCFLSCSKENEKKEITLNQEERLFENIDEKDELSKPNPTVTLNVDNLYYVYPKPAGYYYPTGFNKYLLGENGITHLEENIYLNDLVNLTKEGLRVIRNAIYAKYGYRFNSTDLSDYFMQFPWYKAEFFNVDDRLTEIDKKNIFLIQLVENNYPKNYYEFIGNYGDLEPGIPHGLSNEGPNRFYIYPNGIFKGVWSRYFGWDWDIVDIGTAKNYAEWRKNDYSLDYGYFGLWDYNNILKFDGETIEMGKAPGVIWETGKGAVSSDNKEHIFIDNMWYFYGSDYN